MEIERLTDHTRSRTGRRNSATLAEAFLVARRQVKHTSRCHSGTSHTGHEADDSFNEKHSSCANRGQCGPIPEGWRGWFEEGGRALAMLAAVELGLNHELRNGQVECLNPERHQPGHLICSVGLEVQHIGLAS